MIQELVILAALTVVAVSVGLYVMRARRQERLLDEAFESGVKIGQLMAAIERLKPSAPEGEGEKE
jgi:hypothetical protein